MSISDAYGQIWPQCFNEVAEMIIGKSAGELQSIRENNSNEFDALFANLLFIEGIFKIRAKTEHYNDESRIRYGMIGFSAIDYASECESMTRDIEMMMWMWISDKGYWDDDVNCAAKSLSKAESLTRKIEMMCEFCDELKKWNFIPFRYSFEHFLYFLNVSKSVYFCQSTHGWSTYT